jgi:hypothetical protein
MTSKNSKWLHRNCADIDRLFCLSDESLEKFEILRKFCIDSTFIESENSDELKDFPCFIFDFKWKVEDKQMKGYLKD